jgi:hypothetical protein
VKISFHEVCDNVNVIISSWGIWLDDINESDDIFMVEEALDLKRWIPVTQKSYFSDNSLGIN